MSKEFFLSFCVLVLSFTISFAQEKGSIRGKVIDAGTGESIIGATVVIENTTTGTITDFDGNYSIDLKPGTYNIKISFISYETQKFTDIAVSPGDVKIINANLKEATTELEEVVIKARARQKTEAALMVMQRKSASLMDGISSEQIAKLSDSDAAAALKRVTGVSVQGGKYVYVRGLGDRYTKITLNGAEIPGLDPEKNTVQMDIFPSNIIENIVVHKTFTPDIPGESTGGHVDVVTKDFPNQFTLMASTSIGYNSQASFNDQFLTYEGSKTDWLGYDNGARTIPDRAAKAIDRLIEEDKNQILRTTFTDQELNEITNSFNNIMAPERKAGFLNHSHKFAIGNQTKLFGKTLGYNLGLSYSRDFEYYEDGNYSFNSDPNYDKVENSYNTPVPREALSDDRGTESVGIAGLLNLNYKLSNNHKIGFRFIKNQSGKKIARYKEGIFNYENTDAQERNLGYLERGFNSYQLHGKHVFQGLNKLLMSWVGSFTDMKQDEPDLRFWINLIDENIDPPYKLKTNTSPIRFYREMNEYSINGKLDFELPIYIVRPSKLKFGGAYLYKDRGMDENSFALNYTNQQYNGDISQYLSQRVISQDNALDDSAYYYTSDYESSLINSYTAYQQVISEYVMLDIPVDKFRIVTGLRFEQFNQNVENQINSNDDQYNEFNQDNFDVLPSLNITYSITEAMNIRGGVSQTVARPVFKEIGTNYYDYKTGFLYRGNPELKRSLITNLDIRWEWFMARGEKIALSGFYKSFKDPIEQQLDPQKEKNPELVYFNAPDAQLRGVELEFRKKLSFISLLENFTIGGNFTIVNSEITKDDETYKYEKQGDPDRDKTRPMFGQAPWIINGYLGYENQKLNLSSNLGFNHTGPKLFMITLFGTPYVYEQKEPSLTWNISKLIGNRLAFDFEIKNILNSEYTATYNYETGDKHFLRHQMGRVYSFGVKYQIN
jgi:outer membrane receptor protein involved in Fe transport